jgi:hypothetical protein
MLLLGQTDLQQWFMPGEIGEGEALPWMQDWMINLRVGFFVLVGEAVESLGVVVAVIVAAFFAFLLIRKALRWARTGF